MKRTESVATVLNSGLETIFGEVPIHSFPGIAYLSHHIRTHRHPSFLHLTAVMASTAAAFAPAPQQSVSNVALHATANRASPSALTTSKTDSVGNNLAVKNFLESTEETGLLSQVANAGLLSKAAKAGITLAKLEKLIKAASAKGVLKEVLILAEAAGPEILPLLPGVVEYGPKALPLLAIALDFQPSTLQALALASVAASYGVVSVIPDDTVLEVAAQTIAVATLGVVVPAASLVGATVLGKIKSL